MRTLKLPGATVAGKPAQGEPPDYRAQASKLRDHLAATSEEQPVTTLYGVLDGQTFDWQESPPEIAACVAVLRRYGQRPADPNAKPTKNSDAPPLLILPGATAWRGTFFQPDGGLVDRLRRDRDVWTLDWRGTKVITDIWRQARGHAVPKPISGMTLAEIADTEVTAAVSRVTRDNQSEPFSILGHCIGGGLASLAIARGRLQKVHSASNKPRVLLSTLGLFYRGAFDTWLRANERIDLGIEAPQDEDGNWCLDYAVEDDTEASWSKSYEAVYELWSKTPYPHCHSSFCRRMSSIIGAPYRPDDIDYLHDDEQNGLRKQFGVLPIRLLNDIGRAVRRGLIDINESPVAGDKEALREHLRAWSWTLFTGSENQLWHRDSIDRMFDWLKRDSKIQVTKRIFEQFGHQDLWWSPRALDPDSVYGFVEAQLP